MVPQANGRATTRSNAARSSSTHAEDVYVRSGPGQLVTGQLQRGERFEVSSFARDGRWAWGRAGGDAAREGWVYIGSPTKSYWTQVDSTPDGGVRPQKDLTPQYEPYVTGKDKKDGMTFTRNARVLDPSTAKIYGNYSPGNGPADPMPADFARVGDVGVRYSPHPGWVIVFRYAAYRRRGPRAVGLHEAQRTRDPARREVRGLAAQARHRQRRDVGSGAGGWRLTAPVADGGRRRGRTRTHRVEVHLVTGIGGMTTARRHASESSQESSVQRSSASRRSRSTRLVACGLLAASVLFAGCGDDGARTSPPG